MTKLDVITIRFDPQAHAALQKAAAADYRSMSSLARKVLVEWLQQKQWLEGRPDER
jgi:hypothetical protein